MAQFSSRSHFNSESLVYLRCSDFIPTKKRGPAIRRTPPPLAAHVPLLIAMASPMVCGAATGDATAGAESAASAQLQEITVTAQKRTEDIKDIPFSVSAISGAALLEHHVADYDDITRTVSNSQFDALDASHGDILMPTIEQIGQPLTVLEQRL